MVTQFAVSISLIIGTLVVFQQIQFVKNRPIGYDVNRLIGVPIRSDEVNDHFAALRNDLLQTGVVAEVAKADSPITGASALRNDFIWKGKDSNLRDQFVTLRVSHEFGQTVDWKIVEGRDFSRDFTTDTAGVVINEAAVKYMGLKNPIGEQVKRGDNRTYTIIGVVEDMITQSPYAPVRPTVVFIDEVNSRGMHIKLASDVSTPKALANIEAVFKKHNPADPFEYEFADEEYAQKFATEVRVGKLSGFFAALAILISCLGLFGLASFVAEQRTKEIGIRKVLGASVSNLWQFALPRFCGAGGCFVLVGHPGGLLLCPRLAAKLRVPHRTALVGVCGSGFGGGGHHPAHRELPNCAGGTNEPGEEFTVRVAF